LASTCAFGGASTAPHWRLAAFIYNSLIAFPCKLQLSRHSADMPIMKKLRLLFYSLAFLEIILLTAYQAWGKSVLR
jgi:hypothetical protein